jgi:Prenyltransferase and squalene oxidase repeat
MSIETLVSKQNRDGGWAYVRGASWTEPTVYAVLALLAAGEAESARRGLNWLRSQQLPDGGWPPQTGFDESTWVTALAALVPREQLGSKAHGRAIEWVMKTCGEESTPIFRLRQWLLGNSPARPEPVAWPWVPGTAAWVGPTSISVMALDKENASRPSPAISRRIAEGRRFLNERGCKGGGWNHGSVTVYGKEAVPYPETTGVALAALRGVRSRRIDDSLAVARKFLGESRSADALNWLRLGLLAHDHLPEGYCLPADVTCRTLIETSLDMLVARTRNARELFWG